MARAAPALAVTLLAAACAPPAPSPVPDPQPRPAADDPWLQVAHARDLPELRRRAERTLSELFGVRGLAQVRVDLSLVQRPELMELARELAHPSLRAFTEVETTTSDGRVTLRLYRIYLLRGQSRLETAAALAHELFHVWSVEEGGGIGAGQAWREGAATWVQERVLEAWGREDLARSLLENPDPVYGEGLRRFRKLVADRGAAEALRLAATTLDFPPGY